jgi:hypothetical protein
LTTPICGKAALQSPCLTTMRSKYREGANAGDNAGTKTREQRRTLPCLQIPAALTAAMPLSTNSWISSIWKKNAPFLRSTNSWILSLWRKSVSKPQAALSHYIKLEEEVFTPSAPESYKKTSKKRCCIWSMLKRLWLVLLKHDWHLQWFELVL